MMESEHIHTRKIMCDVDDCSYNRNHICHADSITIGDHGKAVCDTFCLSALQGGNSNSFAAVGACKVEDCLHNHGLLCHCQYITMSFQDDDVYCMKYESRESVLA